MEERSESVGKECLAPLPPLSPRTPGGGLGLKQVGLAGTQGPRAEGPGDAAQLAERLPSVHRALGSSHTPHKLDLVVHRINRT